MLYSGTWAMFPRKTLTQNYYLIHIVKQAGPNAHVAKCSSSFCQNMPALRLCYRGSADKTHTQDPLNALL